MAMKNIASQIFAIRKANKIKQCNREIKVRFIKKIYNEKERKQRRRYYSTRINYFFLSQILKLTASSILITI